MKMDDCEKLPTLATSDRIRASNEGIDIKAAKRIAEMDVDREDVQTRRAAAGSSATPNVLPSTSGPTTGMDGDSS